MSPILGFVHTMQRSAVSRARLGITAAACLAHLSLSGVPAAQAKPFMDYLKPTPITCSPLSDATWGVAGVLPRDLCNGIESAKGKGVPPEWHYWDGQIIRAKDGKYHLFHSTWLASIGFNPGWQSSDAYHSVSEEGVLGPYQRKDYIYTNGGSHKGHNVTALELQDGSYAVVVGEVVPLAIYKSTSLDGPWTACSPNSQIGGSNVSIFQRHDGKFQAVERNGTIAISDTLCGTYVKQKPTCSYTQNTIDAMGNPVTGSIYPKRTSIPGVTNPTYGWQEDPHIWRSGGVYHVIYSGSGDRVGWHVYSTDGLTNWKDNGYGWSPRDYQKIFCYEGSTTCTQWYKMERPSVVLEDGHPTHVTWAVADVDKDNQIPGGSNHGSKIVVIPFDGVAFDNDFGVGGNSGTGGTTGSGGSSGTGGAGGGTGGTSARGGSSGTGTGGGVGGTMGGTGGAGGNASGGTSGRDAGARDAREGGAAGGATSVGGASGGTAGGTVPGSGGAGGAGSGGSQGTGGRAGSGGAGGTASASGGTTASAGSGGATPGSGGAAGAAGAGGSAGGSGGGAGSQGGATTASGSSSGCSCALGAANADANPRRRGMMGALLALLALGLARRRPRRGCEPRHPDRVAHERDLREVAD
jgi:hypothetical protein